MPIPKPGERESRDEFISRCMGDNVMQEYPQDQRAAICFNAWRDVHEGLELIGKLEEAVKLPNGKYKVHGVAIHPMATYHPNEWIQKRVYFIDRLKQAAPSVVGKEFYENHAFALSGSKVTLSNWDDNEDGVYYEGEVTENVANKIKSGYYRGVSINVNPWRKGGGIEFVDGIAPFGFDFEEISFLHNMEPGDPKAWVKLMEAMESQEQVFVPYETDLTKFRMLRRAWVNQELGIEMVYGLPKDSDSYVPVYISFYGIKGWNPQKAQQWLNDNPQYNPMQIVKVEDFIEPVTGILPKTQTENKMEENING